MRTAWVAARTRVPTIDWTAARSVESGERAVTALAETIVALYVRVDRPIHLPSGLCVGVAVRAVMAQDLIEQLDAGQGPAYDAAGFTETLLRRTSHDLVRRHHVYVALRGAAGGALGAGRVVKIPEHHYVGPGTLWCGKLVESFFTRKGRHFHYCVVVARSADVSIIVPLTTKPAPAPTVDVFLEMRSSAVCASASIVSDAVLRAALPSAKRRVLEEREVRSALWAIRSHGVIAFDASDECPDREVSRAYLGGALAFDTHTEVERHLLGCFSCVGVMRAMIEDDPKSDGDPGADAVPTPDLGRALSQYWSRNTRAPEGVTLERMRAEQGVRPRQIWSTRAVGLFVPGSEGERVSAADFDSVPHLILVVSEPEPAAAGPQIVRVVPLTAQIAALAPSDAVFGANETALGHPLGAETWNEQDMIVENLDCCLSPDVAAASRLATLDSEGESLSVEFASFRAREHRQTAYLRAPAEMLRSVRVGEVAASRISRIANVALDAARELYAVARAHAGTIAAAHAAESRVAFEGAQDTTRTRSPLRLRYALGEVSIEIQERASAGIVLVVSQTTTGPATVPGRVGIVGSSSEEVLEFALTLVADPSEARATGTVVIAESIEDLVTRVGLTPVPFFRPEP